MKSLLEFLVKQHVTVSDKRYVIYKDTKYDFYYIKLNYAEFKEFINEMSNSEKLTSIYTISTIMHNYEYVYNNNKNAVLCIRPYYKTHSKTTYTDYYPQVMKKTNETITIDDFTEEYWKNNLNDRGIK